MRTANSSSPILTAPFSGEVNASEYTESFGETSSTDAAPAQGQYTTEWEIPPKDDEFDFGDDERDEFFEE